MSRIVAVTYVLCGRGTKDVLSESAKPHQLHVRTAIFEIAEAQAKLESPFWRQVSHRAARTVSIRIDLTLAAIDVVGVARDDILALNRMEVRDEGVEALGAVPFVLHGLDELFEVLERHDFVGLIGGGGVLLHQATSLAPNKEAEGVLGHVLKGAERHVVVEKKLFEILARRGAMVEGENVRGHGGGHVLRREIGYVLYEIFEDCITYEKDA